MISASRAALLLATSLGAGTTVLAIASGVQARASAVAPVSAVAQASAAAQAGAAGQADAAAPGSASTSASSVSVPVSGHDRVYTADQTSNTVTVIDPSTNTALGTIALGDQRLGSTLSPQYTGDVDVHGLAVSPDHHRLAVVSVTSDTVDIVDTTTNKVVSHTDVGRAAHEGSFTADGRQFWVADRGRDTVTVVDALHGGVVTDLPVGQGPSKVVMSPDGRLAYVNHISLAEVTVVDVASRRVVDHITGLGDAFSSDEAISPDGKQLWAAHKRAGKVSVVDLVHRKVADVLATGPDTNHPQFVDTPTGRYAYLTVGGLDQTWVYRRTAGAPSLVTKIDDHGHAPHGVWPSGDGTRVYVGLEKSDAVDVIDTARNTVTGTIKIGQEPQAVVYAPQAAPVGDAAGLGRQGLDQGARDVPTVLPDGRAGDTLDPARGRTLEATVRPVKGLDMIQLQARGLQPNTTYQAYSDGVGGRRQALVSFTTDGNGNAPMVLAFSAFDGHAVSVAVKGTAPARAAAAPLDGMHAGNAVSTADLLYCDCC